MSFAVTREKKYQNATELALCYYFKVRRGDVGIITAEITLELVSRHVLGKRASLTLDRYLANERMIRCPGEIQSESNSRHDSNRPGV